MEKRSKSQVRSSQSKTAPKKISSGRITRNPFLNFLRDFRKSNFHKYDICELTRRGAQLWRGMSEKEKSPYVSLSKHAPKFRRTRGRGRKGRKRRKKRRRRRRRTRSRSSSAPTEESLDRRSSERERRRRNERREERREENRREDRHSHSHEGGKEGTKHHDNKRSGSREKRNEEYELKYKNLKYEDTRDFI